MKKVIIIFFVMSATLMYAGSFVIKKEQNSVTKKKISTSSMCEQLCKSLYDLLHEVPQLLREVGTLQEQALDIVSDFISSSGSGTLAKHTAAKRELIQKSIQECQDAIIHAELKMKELVALLKTPKV